MATLDVQRKEQLASIGALVTAARAISESVVLFSVFAVHFGDGLKDTQVLGA